MRSHLRHGAQRQAVQCCSPFGGGCQTVQAGELGLRRIAGQLGQKCLISRDGQIGVLGHKVCAQGIAGITGGGEKQLGVGFLHSAAVHQIQNFLIALLPKVQNGLRPLGQGRHPGHGLLGIGADADHGVLVSGGDQVLRGLVIKDFQGVPVLRGIIGGVVPAINFVQPGQILVEHGGAPYSIQRNNLVLIRGEILDGVLIPEDHRAAGFTGPTHKFQSGRSGQGAGGQRFFLIISISCGFHGTGALAGVEGDGIGDGGPSGIQSDPAVLGFAGEIGYLRFIRISFAVDGAFPVPEGIAGTAEGLRGQGDGGIPYGGHGSHGTESAACIEADGVVVGQPFGKQGAAVGGREFLNRIGILGIVIPLHPVMTGLGVLFQIDVPIHILTGPVGQGQRFQIIVFGNEAAAITGEIGVVAQIQMLEAVVIQVDKLQLFERGKVDFGEAVVKGLDEFQIGVGGKIHGCQVVAAAVDDFQRGAAGQVDGGHMVMLAKKRV